MLSKDVDNFITEFSSPNFGLVYKPEPVEHFPIGAYFLNTFGELPKFCFKSKPNVYTKIDEFIELIFNGIPYTYTLIGRSTYAAATQTDVYHLKDDSGASSIVEIVYNMMSDENDDGNSAWVSLYTANIEHYNVLSSSISGAYKPAPKRGFVSMLIKRGHSYDTTPLKMSDSIKIDIESNYNDDFEKIHSLIIESLNKKSSGGLVLLHGLPGTGKSYYLRHIANNVDKQVIYIPPYLTEFLTSPEMLPFLMDHPDSILLIEDAEKVITDREQTASSGVSNILNITDGILSDLLKMQIVATFNMDKDNIDKALLRKGRLIAEYEFGKLSVEKSNNKLKELGKDYVTNVPLTLTEIYNIDDMDFGENVKKVKPSIGFS